jgi:ParB-like chromosome segregation protein Spo0J
MKKKITTQGTKIEMINVSSLKPHPLNNSIYTSKRDKEDDDLRISIHLNGLLEPIVVDKKSMQIISGHRRFKSITELGWKTVPTRLVEIDFDIIKLIQFNKYREKTVEEKRNEEREMKSYLKLLPPKERKRILDGTPMREYISNEIGLSFSSIIKLNYIEEHNSELLQDIYLGKISPTEAYKLVKSQVEKKDYKFEFDVLDIKGRIKKLSKNITKQHWLDIIDEIYQEN